MTKEKTHTRIATLLVLCAAAAAAQTSEFAVVAHIIRYVRPYGSVVQGLDGLLYSTTEGAGGQPGQVFKVSSSGRLTTLVTQHGQSEEGLTLGPDGNFYGTTVKGGPHKGGTIFKITPSGKLTRLYNFCSLANCADGELPISPLLLGTDGHLYGTTIGGGPGCTQAEQGCGTVFRITLAGEITFLYTFCARAGCVDGGGPSGAIVQASDGNLYGTTRGGGNAGGGGTIYRLTLGGKLTSLHSFCNPSHCAGGSDPEGGLALGPDGALYGTTVQPAEVFRITLDGTFTDLQSLSGYSLAAPIPATDGNLYGTTAGGGAYGAGSLFKITTSGGLTTLYSFCSVPGCKKAAQPHGSLFQATDGNLYGTTYEPSTVFRLSLGLAPFVSPLPTYGKVGREISILGNNLTGATAVSFNGTPDASFTVNATGSAITATVPDGATTGLIQVTLADARVLSSNVPFQVTD